MQRIQPRLDRAQALRVEFDAAEVIVERVHGFLQLDARRLQRVQHGLELVVDVDQLAELLLERHQLRQQRRRFILGQQVQRLLRALDQAGRMRQPAVFVADIGPFAFARRELFQLAELPLEALALEQHVLRVALEFFALPRQRAPLPVGGGDRLHVFLQAGLRIEQLALRIGFQQGLVRMLAMDVDQHFADLAQLRDGGGHAIDEGFRAAAVVDHAAQQHRAVAGVEFILGQPGLQYRRQRAGELGADVGLGRALAHHAGVSPPAQRQRQRVDQDRFAGAGLAGEHRKPG